MEDEHSGGGKKGRTSRTFCTHLNTEAIHNLRKGGGYGNQKEGKRERNLFKKITVGDINSIRGWHSWCMDTGCSLFSPSRHHPSEVKN